MKWGLVIAGGALTPRLSLSMDALYALSVCSCAPGTPAEELAAAAAAALAAASSGWATWARATTTGTASVAAAGSAASQWGSSWSCTSSGPFVQPEGVSARVTLRRRDGSGGGALSAAGEWSGWKRHDEVQMALAVRTGGEGSMAAPAEEGDASPGRQDGLDRPDVWHPDVGLPGSGGWPTAGASLSTATVGGRPIARMRCLGPPARGRTSGVLSPVVTAARSGGGTFMGTAGPERRGCAAAEPTTCFSLR